MGEVFAYNVLTKSLQCLVTGSSTEFHDEESCWHFRSAAVRLEARIRWEIMTSTRVTVMVMLSSAADSTGLAHQQPCTVILSHKGYTMVENTLFASNRAETCYNKYYEDRGKEECVAA